MSEPIPPIMAATPPAIRSGSTLGRLGLIFAGLAAVTILLMIGFRPG